jgi:hypothetical protein
MKAPGHAQERTSTLRRDSVILWASLALSIPSDFGHREVLEEMVSAEGIEPSTY